MAVVGQADIAPRRDRDHLAAIVFHQQAIGFDRFVPLAVFDVRPGTLQVGADRVVDFVELDGAGQFELAGGLCPGGAERVRPTASSADAVREASAAAMTPRRRRSDRASRGRLSSSEQSLSGLRNKNPAPGGRVEYARRGWPKERGPASIKELSHHHLCRASATPRMQL